MEMSPPQSPVKAFPTVRLARLSPSKSTSILPGTPPTVVPTPHATPTTPSRAQLLLSKLEKLQTDVPAVLARISRSPEPADDAAEANASLEEESDMDMSPPASPTVHSSSVESATAVHVDMSDSTIVLRVSPTPDHASQEESGASSEDLQVVDELLQTPVAELETESEPIAVDEVPRSPPHLNAAVVPVPPPVASPTVSPRPKEPEPLPVPQRPVAEVAPPRSLTIIPVTYQDSDSPAAPQLAINGVPFTMPGGAEQDRYQVPETLPLSEALRRIVVTRLRCDIQTRDDRVNPVLLANLTTVGANRQQPPARDVVQEVFNDSRKKSILEAHDRLQPSLAIRFAQRRAVMAEKVRTLQREYLHLHERWLAHCAKLDDVAKAHALEEAAATAGRTTRRSAALGDAVRSDLEMEQIIASLGNEELTDAAHLAVRNVATIPDMLSVTPNPAQHLYDDTNNLVDNPIEFYAARTGVDDWTEQEQEIFVHQYALYPKQFGIIADFLPYKTAAQCVIYYYLHKKKFIDFRQVVNRQANGKRKRGRRADKGKGNALLTDIRRHDDEVSRDSTPSAPATRKKRPNPAPNTEPRKSRKTAASASLVESPVSTPTPDPEPDTRRRRRRPVPTARAVASIEQQDAEESVPVRFASDYPLHALTEYT